MDRETATAVLTTYKDLIRRYSGLSDRRGQTEQSKTIRSELMQMRPELESLLLRLGCMYTVTLAPPSAVGGLGVSGANPFDFLFHEMYGYDIRNSVVDTIDQALGAVRMGRLEQVPRNASVKSVQVQEHYAFIAMAMDPADRALEDVLHTIKRAAADLGISAERIDDQNHNSRITDRIMESIQRAQFVICDLTYSKPNVFFEAGYAHGLSKVPIYIARKGTKLEFDIKDYPVIFFETYRELEENLKGRLNSIATKKNTPK